MILDDDVCGAVQIGSDSVDICHCWSFDQLVKYYKFVICLMTVTCCEMRSKSRWSGVLGNAL